MNIVFTIFLLGALPMEPERAIEQIRSGYTNLVSMRDDAYAAKKHAAAQCLDQKVRAAAVTIANLQGHLQDPAALEETWIAVSTLNSKAFLCL